MKRTKIENGKNTVQFSEENEVNYLDNDEEIEKKEADQFNYLCDGVITSLALTHTSLKDYLEFKDALMEHHLPSNVLLKLSLISGKLFRSFSDLQHPINELVRVVRVYSVPWNEKSIALKKLHDDYEKKSAQLNVALHQLSLQNAEKERVNHASRLMNWERLFIKAQTKSGHGRRWKFRMHDFRVKAEMGIEHLREYFHIGDGEDGDSDDEIEAVMHPLNEESDEIKQEDEQESNLMGNLDEKKSETDKSRPTSNLVEIDDLESEEDDISYPSTPPVPVKTTDTAVSTEDPDFENFLHVRIHRPRGFENTQGLKCVLTYGKSLFKTEILDLSAKLEETPDTGSSQVENRATKTGGGRRLLGRQKRVTIQDDNEQENIRKRNEEREQLELSSFQEIILDIPADVISGASIDVLYDSMKFTVLANGPVEDIIATTTVQMDDIQSLELPVRFLPTDVGDVPDFLASKKSQREDEEFDSQKQKPVQFPLYSINDKSSAPVGVLPLSCFWSKRQRHQLRHRYIGTGHIYDVVEELTGIDLNVITKEELTREKLDEGVSPRPQTPLPPSFSREEVDVMQENHSNELQALREDYEMRLKQFAEELEIAERKVIEAFVHSKIRPQSRGSRHNSGRSHSPKDTQERGVSPGFPAFVFTMPSEDEEWSEENPNSLNKPLKSRVVIKKQEVVPQAPKKNFMISRPLPKWGENLPPNFLDRLKIFTHLSQQHREELAERMRSEIAAVLERRLAEAYKLNIKNGGAELDSEAATAALLQDVCLPALFMPTGARNPSGSVYNPRAHHYFHPSGIKAEALRLTQPPSIFSLPPLPNRVALLSLFDLCQQPPQILKPKLDVDERGQKGLRPPPPTLAPTGAPTQSSFV